MASWSHRVNVVRLLLCAAFIALAFVLASWTTAHADDRDLLGTVADTVPTLEQTPGGRTALAEGVSGEAEDVVPVKATVTKPVAVVEDVAKAPVTTVDETTAVVVRTTTDLVSHNTSETVETVDRVVETAPVAADVIEPVVERVAPVTETAPFEPAPTVPEAVLELVESSVPFVAPDESDPAAPPELVVPVPGDLGEPGTSGESQPEAPVAQQDPHVRVHSFGRPLAAGADDVVWASSALPAKGSAPGPLAPRPAPGVLGVQSGPTSVGSSGGGGLVLATVPTDLVLPRSTCPTAQSRTSALVPGPAQDPGSRPG